MAMLGGVASALQPVSAREGCWDEYPRAERAFEEGFEAFLEGEYELAIRLFREARDARREPDATCTIQLYGRGPESKAYYLPYYYLGRAFYEGRDQMEQSEYGCKDAAHYVCLSWQRREETYDISPTRFRRHLREMNRLLEACGEPSLEDLLTACGKPSFESIASAPARPLCSETVRGGAR